MTCPSAHDWNLFSMGLCADDRRRQMQAHAEACTVCRVQMVAASEAHDDLRSLHRTFEQDHDGRRQQLMEALSQCPTPLAHRPRRLWHVGRYAAALALIVTGTWFVMHRQQPDDHLDKAMADVRLALGLTGESLQRIESSTRLRLGQLAPAMDRLSIDDPSSPGGIGS